MKVLRFNCLCVTVQRLGVGFMFRVQAPRVRVFGFLDLGLGFNSGFGLRVRVPPTWSRATSVNPFRVSGLGTTKNHVQARRS